MPPASASVADTTTLQIILHSTYITPLIIGLGVTGFGGGKFVRWE